jgi:hypothetical protein
VIARAAVAALFAFYFGYGATFEVGPAREFESLADIPWARLEPGDTVLVNWRREPYRTLFVLCRKGTADKPITIRGVLGPDGQRPVISGEGAVVAPGLNYWNENRGVIKVGGANIPPDTLPEYIVIENLEVRSGRSANRFVGRTGAEQSFAANAAAIYVEKAHALTVRNCVLTDSGNGLFVGANSGANLTRDILVDSNYIYGNGNQGSAFEHNTYTEALGITYQFNRFGPLRAGALGNNLKDRSAGLTVRYNWIEGGNRQLDLVESGTAALLESPRYRATFVYGNVLIEPADAGNRQIAHYGGDGGNVSRYRKGWLYFYHNTVVTTRTDRTTLVRLSTNEERADVRNNIIYSSLPGSTVSLLDVAGELVFLNNWIRPGYRISFSDFQGTVIDRDNLVGEDPGFVDFSGSNFRPQPAAPVVDTAAPLAEATFPDHDVLAQYWMHQAGQLRSIHRAPDIGAYEFTPPAPAGGDEPAAPMPPPE